MQEANDAIEHFLSLSENHLFVPIPRRFFGPTRASGNILSSVERAFRASRLGRPLHDYSTSHFLTRLIVTDMQDVETGDCLSRQTRGKGRAVAAEGLRSLLRSMRRSSKRSSKHPDDAS